ncbi:MAG: hypothetical protein ACRDQZ_11515, partial [Mycobacteriales bacterium]
HGHAAGVQPRHVARPHHPGRIASLHQTNPAAPGAVDKSAWTRGVDAASDPAPRTPANTAKSKPIDRLTSGP